jgi:D-allulose-6-phosphate 3-epimerase
MKKPLFNASLMCMDMLHMQEQFNILNHRIDMYHVDIMDGHFAKTLHYHQTLFRYAPRSLRNPLNVT